MSLSVLTINRLNTLIERQKLSDWIKNKHIIAPKYKHTERMKVKGRKNIVLTKWKKIGISILISD